MEFTPIRPVVMKYAPIIGVATAAYGIILYSGSLMNNSFLPMLTYVISIGGLFLAMREYKAQNQGFMPFNKGFGLGFLTSFVAGLISTLISTIYTTYINTDAIPTLLEQQRMKLEEDPNMTEEILDMSMNMTESLITLPYSVLVAVIGGAIGAAIIGAILAAIMKKDPDTY
jgi:hypothetical protein